MDALKALVASIPDWQTRLDELNGQIEQRQIELAKLVEPRPPSTLRNKGSTESLKPKNEPPNFHPQNGGAEDERAQNLRNSAASRPTAGPQSETPAPQIQTQHSSPGPLQRNSSQPSPCTKIAVASPILRKRKTESVASHDTSIPKYRTRSMIIVYYDSAVQEAFEDLVKSISSSRNDIRRTKAAVRMAEIKRVAEMQAGDDDSGEEDSGDEDDHTGLPRGLAVSRRPLASRENDSTEDYPMPTLKFVSTRRMGPSRDQVGSNRVSNSAASHALAMLRAEQRRNSLGLSALTDIYDNLDKGLEWCQSMCEHAAHQFLRDGDCSAETAGVKKRLSDVKEKARAEVSRLDLEARTKQAIENTTRPSSNGGTAPSGVKRGYRELRNIQLRKSPSLMPKKEPETMELEADDDSGVSDVEPPLVWRSARGSKVC